MLHPNILAFYFFNQGLERKGLWKIAYVPLIMVPYGLLIGYLLFNLSSFAKQQIESSWFFFLLIIIWLVIAFIVEHKRKIKREFKLGIKNFDF